MRSHARVLTTATTPCGFRRIADLMDARALVAPLEALHCVSHTLPTRRNPRVRFPRSKAFLGVRGFSVPGVRASNSNGSASSLGSSGSEDDGDEPPVSKNDPEGEYQNGGVEWLVNGEKGDKNELPSTPTCIPSKELLLRLRRNAELRRKYYSAAEPPAHQPSADLQVHDSEVVVPSWAVTALTFAIAFTAGVALAQFRGGLVSRNKPAVVDVRVAPSGIASVPCSEQLLGHFRAQEAPETDLKAVLADGSVRLDFGCRFLLENAGRS